MSNKDLVSLKNVELSETAVSFFESKKIENTDDLNKLRFLQLEKIFYKSKIKKEHKLEVVNFLRDNNYPNNIHNFELDKEFLAVLKENNITDTKAFLLQKEYVLNLINDLEKENDSIKNFYCQNQDKLLKQLDAHFVKVNTSIKSTSINYEILSNILFERVSFIKEQLLKFKLQCVDFLDNSIIKNKLRKQKLLDLLESKINQIISKTEQEQLNIDRVLKFNYTKIICTISALNKVILYNIEVLNRKLKVILSSYDAISDYVHKIYSFYNNNTKSTNIFKKAWNFFVPQRYKLDSVANNRLVKTAPIGKIQMKRKKVYDIASKSYTIINVVLLTVLLGIILGFLFRKSSGLFSLKLLKTNYKTQIVKGVFPSPEELVSYPVTYKDPKKTNTIFVKRWGISLKTDKTVDGVNCVKIVYIDKKSPFNHLYNRNKPGEHLEISKGYSISGFRIKYASGGEAAKETDLLSAENTAKKFENAVYFSNISFETAGGGIRGSFLITVILIVLTLVLALPMGIVVAIYLNEFAKPTKFKGVLVSLINMINGIPSIIFGLVGSLIFVPLVNKITNSNSYSIIAGVLTMIVILLPVIISTTIESLKSVPQSYRLGSLALGASKTQTIFKVVLPNARAGILTASLLSVARIIGESAALIFVMGTNIVDSIFLHKGGTSLAVHIWSVMGGENPNIALASAISVYILIIIFILSMLVKFTNYWYNKKKGVSSR